MPRIFIANYSPWLKLQAWLSDLADARVRGEIVKALYVDNLVTLIVHIAASAVFLWAYGAVRANLALCAVLLLWCCLAGFSLLKEVQVKAHMRAGDLTPEQSWHFLSGYVGSSLLQTVCLSVILVFFLGHEGEGLKSYVVIGILFYYFGSIIKDFSVRVLILAYTLILLVPMTVFHLLLGSATGFVISGFLLVFIVGVINFAGSMGRVVTSQILQRYALQGLTTSLTVERDRADAANAAKSRFFTAASHDARQPLQAIGLLYDSIAGSPSMAESDRRVLDKIGANLLSIRNLFNRVLDISRIETGSVEPHLQAVPLQNLFNTLDAQMGELAASKALWLRFAPTTAVVWHDPELLERMVGNLTHNALKFTEQGGVWVGYRASRGVLEVRDSGVGVAPAEQQQIFEEFYQLDNTARKRGDGGGLGLGLSIVKRLATLTDTAIGLRSASGRGTTFWLRLVRSTESVAKTPEAAMGQGSLPMHSAMLQGWSILLVEDDDELRTLFADGLTEKGAQVTTCAGMDEAAQRLGTGSYDAVITDYRLGTRGSGLDVAKLARQRLGGATPVIVITGDTSGVGLKELAGLAHTWVLHKPVRIEQMAEIFLQNSAQLNG